MESAQSLWAIAREAWRGVFPEAWQSNLAYGFVVFAGVFLLLLVVETACGTRTRNYSTRDFAHDSAYYLYYRSGAQRLLLSGPVLLALDVPLSFLDLRLLHPLPPLAQVALGLLIGDFLMYWLHRAQHAFPFLWAFHTTHHSSEHLTFAAFQRFHPLEVLVGEIAGFVILRLLGFEIYAWVALYLFTTLVGELQHSQVPWRLGPLYRVIVTPSFHAYHHSPDRALHDRNFGGLFAFWDYLFGTAVDERTPAPRTFGLADVKPTSLWRTLADPFVLLRRFYGSKVPAAQAPLLDEDRSAAR
jgi:sterol desaturase/sphingolipid hydroxylase (fatty acid hydroxylase superfamily)